MTGRLYRLGHVLGWAGNCLAIVILLAGASFIAPQALDIWSLQQQPYLYEVTLRDGCVVHVASLDPQLTVTDETKADAVRAAEAFGVGAQSSTGVWNVTPTGEKHSGGLLMVVSKHYEISQVWNRIILVVVIAGVVALVVFLIGRATRYIFAGSWK